MKLVLRLDTKLVVLGVWPLDDVSVVINVLALLAEDELLVKLVEDPVGRQELDLGGGWWWVVVGGREWQ